MLSLYEQVIDLENPKLSVEEIAEIKGYYTSKDDSGRNYELEITENGSGTLTVTSASEEGNVTTITFDNVRHNENGLQISSSEGSVFTFAVNADKSLTFNYYLTTIELTLSEKQSDSNTPTDTPSDNGCKGSVASSLISLIAVGGLLMINRKKSAIKGGN